MPKPTLKMETSSYLGPFISRVAEGAEAFVIAKELAAQPAVIYVAMDDARMRRTADVLALFFPDIEALQLPAWDAIPYDRISPSVFITNQRMKTLSTLAHRDTKQKTVVLTTINALLQKLPPRSLIQKNTLLAKPNDTLPRETLTRFLIENGYINVASANEGGEFAVRGSILDIVPPGNEMSVGYRLDFFGDTLESIRSFDPLTQISGGKEQSLSLVPASEVLLNEDSIQRFRHAYRDLFGSTVSGDPLYEAVSDGRKYAGMEHWLPLYYPSLDTVLDYLPGATVLLANLAAESAHERSELIRDSYETRLQHEKVPGQEAKYHPIAPETLYLMEDAFTALLKTNHTKYLEPFNAHHAGEDAGFIPAPNFAALAKEKTTPALALLKETVATRKQGQVQLLACVTEGSRNRMERLLNEESLEYEAIENIADRRKSLARSGKLGLVVLPIDQGFISDQIALYSESDILGERLIRIKKKGKGAKNFLTEAANLQPGELIVHKDHGIGRFEGLENIAVLGASHDFLLLIYHGGDKLYVPVENIELVSRYGGETETAQLDKLGSLAWQQRSAAVKKRIKVTADELMKVAAKRALKTAPIYSASQAYEQFEARFPYSETDDQLRAIEEVIADLASGHPMDRLVCGDVGFGKTEVALRAAFVVAHPAEGESRAQVAVITPTTLLCRQHYESFTKRFAGFPVTIRMLSRMVSAKEARETKRMMESGEVDIVIGTHALLAKNIQFKNLGLVVVDEEQRFGVAQKERLKKLRATTHILTLTATPIPRTLQLSLTGIRDLSLITTPPVDRLAVRTFVMPYDSVVIREAILREHYRGGRTFYVCPRIKDMEEIEPKLKALLPEVKIVSAHGQMSAEMLDEIMNGFYSGEYDVLLATTIIESGLDIPMANTLVVHRSEMYGLAQLYQIRGRVGRSRVRAYAYLTLPPKKMPTKNALKRLEVMQKLDTLGAGFTLATHDMDIRGFGNLLGDEQSGHIKEVGLELYQEMLREAIAKTKHEAKSEQPEEPERLSPKISVGLSVLIPESYVTDLSLRLGLYRRIGELEIQEDINSIGAEMVDRFGTMPEELENLLAVVRLKLLAAKAGIVKLDAGEKGGSLQFLDNRFSNPEGLIDLITRNPHSMKINGKDMSVVITAQNWVKPEDRLKGVEELLKKITGLMV